MKTGQMGTLAVAVIAAALAGCASNEVKKAPPPAPAAAPAPAHNMGSAAASSAPRAPIAAKPAPARMASALPSKRSVYFDFDKYDIKPMYRPVIEANAKYIEAHNAAVTITGNCDERGSAEYNLALGQRRADAVANVMKLLGVPASDMRTVSYGSEKPLDPGHNEAAWAKNRRSDIVYNGG